MIQYQIIALWMFIVRVKYSLFEMFCEIMAGILWVTVSDDNIRAIILNIHNKFVGKFVVGNRSNMLTYCIFKEFNVDIIQITSRDLFINFGVTQTYNSVVLSSITNVGLFVLN